MSAHGHATAGDAAEPHEHHHYEGIPADRAGPDEPRTPLWLPLVGISLLLFTLLAYLVTRPAGKSGAELAREASPDSSAAAAPAPQASAPSPRMRRLPGLDAALGGPPGAAPGGQPPGAAPGGQPPGGARPGFAPGAAPAGAAPGAAPVGAARPGTPGAPAVVARPRPAPAPPPAPPPAAPGQAH